MRLSKLFGPSLFVHGIRALFYSVNIINQNNNKNNDNNNNKNDNNISFKG